MKILLKIRKRFRRYVRIDPSGCHVWTGGTRNGYGHFNHSRERGSVYAHRLAYEWAKGPIPDGLDVCHTCDFRLCVNPDHLFVGTRKDNMADAVRKGRHARGETHGRSKLTEGVVRQIRELASEGQRHRAIASRFGISTALVSLVVNRKRWGHVA